MPDHVHAMVWFPKADQLSSFMNRWKDQASRIIHEFFRASYPNYSSRIQTTDPIWQARYYGFNIWSRSKVEEKLEYMHQNPVKAGIVDKPEQWSWGSARWYLKGKPVGVPIGWPTGLENESEIDSRMV